MTPNTTVTLYKTKLDVTNKHILFYEGDVNSAVMSLSTGQPLIVENCYWLRENVNFRCNGNINTIKQYNYCVYKNNNDGITYCAFIINYRYINDAMTEVILSTDSWMTYLPKLTFNPSPMIRCHPSKGYEISIISNLNTDCLNLYPENINVILYPESNSPYSLAQNTDDEDRILATGLINIDPVINFKEFCYEYSNYIGVRNGYADAQATNAWQAIFNSVKNASDRYFDWFDTYLTSTPSFIQGVYQRPTNIYKKNEMNLLQKVVTGLATIGFGDWFISAYVIPGMFKDIFMNGPNGAGLPISSVYSRAGSAIGDTISFTYTEQSDIHWNKIKYSSQYNAMDVNFFGNKCTLPFDYLVKFRGFGINNHDISFDMRPLVYENGYVILNTYIQTGAGGFDNYFSLSSPTWDKVPISAFAPVTLESSVNAALGEGKSKLATIKNIINGVANIGEGFSSSYLDIDKKSLKELNKKWEDSMGFSDKNYSDYIGENIKLKSRNISFPVSIPNMPHLPTYIGNGGITQSAFTSGNNSHSIAAYMSMYPILTYNFYHPNEGGIRKLNEYFGAYGYNFNGETIEITPKNTELKWVYYETGSANIEGKDIPQENIIDLIDMFNNGVFIYQSPNDFKQLTIQNKLANHY